MAVTALYDALKAKTNGATKLAILDSFDQVLSLSLLEKASKAREEQAKAKSAQSAGGYTITGENRDSRSRMGHRLVLRRQTTTVYAGEVFEIAPYYGMDEDLLRRSFNLILGTWNNS